jgi:hypothetical protein
VWWGVVRGGRVGGRNCIVDAASETNSNVASEVLLQICTNDYCSEGNTYQAPK